MNPRHAESILQATTPHGEYDALSAEPEKDLSQMGIAETLAFMRTRDDSYVLTYGALCHLNDLLCVKRDTMGQLSRADQVAWDEAAAIVDRAAALNHVPCYD